jgi:Flp pilus assembly protein TadG
VGLGVYKALQVSETPDVSIMTLRRHRSRTRTLGPAMVEFALVVPVMLFDRR